MANILDYVMWRGDIPLDQVQLGEVDGLILSYLAYMPYDDLVPLSMQGEGVLLRDVANSLLQHEVIDARILANTEKEDRELLTLLAKSVRFGGLRMLGYVDYFDETGEEQFSAVTFLLPDDTAFIAFRGTDSTLVGWKEDFNMAFSAEVPSQRDAVLYTEALYDRRHVPLILGGHSKGGNLAVYAGMFCREDVRAYVLGAFNFDGPGFNEEIASSPAFSSLLGRVYTYVTQSSLIGILLWHKEPFTVIKSDSIGLFQHLVYTWQVMGGRFIRQEERSESSRFADDVLKAWLSEVTPQQRESFIDGVYSVIAAAQGKNLRDLFDGKSLLAMLRAAGSLDGKTRSEVLDAIRLLGDAVKETALGMLEERINEKKA